MALTFPLGPADGDTFTVSGITWTYSATADSWTGSMGGGTITTQFDFQAGAAAPTTTTKADGTTPVTEGDHFWDATNNNLYVYSGAGVWSLTGSKWTTQTSGISRADRIKVGASADPLVAVDVVGTVGQNAAAGPAIDASAGQVWTISSAANPTVTISGTIPQSTTLVCVVSGGGTVTWPASIKWPGGTAPTWSSGTDIVSLFTADAGVTWYGNSFSLDAK